VLAIATKYDMEVIRQNSIEEVKRATPPLDPIDQIVAARKYNCQELAEAPMEVLVKRNEPLTFDEMVKLSPEDLHKWIMAKSKPTKCRFCSNAFQINNLYCHQCGNCS
jgi:hypothetical protein